MSAPVRRRAGILALKKWLATLEDITIVVISHDRAFLDDTVDEIILLQARRSPSSTPASVTSVLHVHNACTR